MNWLALATATISKLPLEKFIRKPDERESLEKLKRILEQAPPPREKQLPEASDDIVQRRPGPASPRSQPLTSVSLQETVDYQNKEIGKLLLRMERHYAQRLRINGVPCDCGSQKHLLDLESLCEETIPMVSSPEPYYRIIDWIGEVGPKSTDEAAKSGLYDADYPRHAAEARDFRKTIIGTLDPKALFPRRIEGRVSTILPVLSAEEREEIRQRAHQQIEEILHDTGGDQRTGEQGSSEGD